VPIQNGFANLFGLRTAPGPYLADALFEFAISAQQYAPEIF